MNSTTGSPLPAGHASEISENGGNGGNAGNGSVAGREIAGVLVVPVELSEMAIRRGLVDFEAAPPSP